MSGSTGFPPKELTQTTDTAYKRDGGPSVDKLLKAHQDKRERKEKEARKREEAEAKLAKKNKDKDKVKDKDKDSVSSKFDPNHETMQPHSLT